MLDFGDHYRPFLEQKLGGAIDENSVCIARLRNGAPVAVFAFSGWHSGDIEGSLWCEPTGLSVRLLRCCAHYVFGQLGCNRITIKVRADNEPMLALAPRIGFKHEGVMRRANNGVDLVIFGLLSEECRWHGQQTETAETA